MEIPKFLVWYKTSDDNFRVYYNHNKTFATYINLRDENINQFEMNDKSEATDDNLIKFSNNLIQWRNEVIKSKYLLKSFDYFDNSLINKDGSIFNRTHSNNVLTFIKRFVKYDFKNYDAISRLEEDYFSKCNKGGIVYCEPGVYDCYGFDFKFFYPSIMASKEYSIPTKEAYEIEIHEIPKCFQYGIYNIQIQSDDKQFNKIFAFSKDNHYTHYSLNWVLEYNKKYKGNITLHILNNKALIYNSDCLVTGYSVFNCWYNRLVELKTEFPKNKIIKTLGSTAWGQLQSQNIIIKTENEIIKEGLMISTDYTGDYFIKDIIVKSDGNDIYKLIDTKKPMYKYPFRLKAFITDFGRVKLAQLAIKDIDDIIRIQTDGIVYSTPKKFSVPNFIIDEGKTGTFEWFHVNKWENLDL